MIEPGTEVAFGNRLGHIRVMFQIELFETDVLLRLRRAEVSTGTLDFHIVPRGVFAHAPSTLRAHLPVGRSIRGEFGYVDGAWQKGRPAGARFVVSVHDNQQILFDRTLDPLRTIEDRGRQSFMITIPSIGEPDREVVLTIAPVNDDNSWGWTYWSEFRIQEGP
jgi:hypothetical protein